MRNPRQPFPDCFRLTLGILAGLAAAPVALAGSEEPAAVQTAQISASKAAAAPLSGPQVYSNVCIACHAPPGVGGAPALGDGEAWAPRIDQGFDMLTDHALHGFSGDAGLMPGKGGRLDLSDEEIISAVEYMVEQAAR